MFLFSSRRQTVDKHASKENSADDEASKWVDGDVEDSNGTRKDLKTEQVRIRVAATDQTQSALANEDSQEIQVDTAFAVNESSNALQSTCDASETKQLELARHMDTIRSLLSDGPVQEQESEAPGILPDTLVLQRERHTKEEIRSSMPGSFAFIDECTLSPTSMQVSIEDSKKHDAFEVGITTISFGQFDLMNKPPVGDFPNVQSNASDANRIVSDNEYNLDTICQLATNPEEVSASLVSNDEGGNQQAGADSGFKTQNGGNFWPFRRGVGPLGGQETLLESVDDTYLLGGGTADALAEFSPMKEKTSILDAIEKIESKTIQDTDGSNSLADGNWEKELEAPQDDSFLVNDELLAKTLSIYEQISKEDELLLESFRATEQPVGAVLEKLHNAAAVDPEPASVAHLKKIRLQAPREISQESQSLFDILNRDFASVTPRVTVNIAGLSRPLCSDDVKLCFVAFVDCFSPPLKSHFATEYNYTVDDFCARRGRQRSVDDLSLGSSDSGESSIASGHDTDPDPERFARPHVPNHIVMALWSDVIRCRFLDGADVTQALAKKIETARGDAFATALAFIRDTLVLLGVLDVRKMTKSFQRNEVEEILSMEETYFVEASRGRKQAFEEVLSVHQDIHQEYGEYLTKSTSNENYCSILAMHEKRWNGVIVDASSQDVHKDAAVAFAVQLLPWNTIRANRFRDAASLLTDKKFLSRRLQALGVLEGTTAQVTDAEELVLRHFEKRKAILCFEGIDPDQTMLDAYERTRKAISRQIEELCHTEDNIATELPHHRRLKVMHIETGKALHLMGVSLGAQGFMEQELDYCKQALSLKRTAAFGPTVTVADTLHCVGYSLDSAGLYLEAMEFYNQALAIRRDLLGNEDLRVAETLHNKGAILCENGECDDAILCLEEALRIRIGHYGEHHERCADTQQWIGNVLREWGRHEEGLQYFQTALKTKKVILGPDHEEVANTLQNMAVVLDDMGRYSLSLECYNEALRIYSLQYGKEHIRVADTLQRIATDFSILDEPEQALDHYRQAIALRETLLGDEKCRLSDAKFIVRSLIYADEFDVDDAISSFGDLIECYEESLELAKVLHSGDHETLSRILHRLGDLCFEIQEYDQAIEKLEEALKSERVIAVEKKVNEENVCSMLRKKGVVHLYKKEYHQAKHCFESVVYRQRKSTATDLGGEASALYCLGVAFDSLGAHKLSLSAFTEALNAWKEENGESDVRCGYSLYWLGNEEFKANRFDEAIVWCRGALRTFKENKTEVDYAIVAKTLNLLGQTHEKLEDKQSALRCYGEGIRLVRWKLGENHEFVIDMLCRSGKIKQTLGLPDEAIGLYEDAINVMKSSDREDVQLCSIVQTLGLLFQAQTDYDRAKDLLSESYRMYESVVGQDDLRSAGAVLKLGRVLDLQGSHEAAMQCYRETLRVQRNQLSPEHEDVAETLYRMGANLSLSDRYEESIKCFQQALSLQRNAHGDNHLLVARTLNKLAASYKAIGSFDKSIVCYKEAMRIFMTDGESNMRKIAEISFEVAECHEANDNYQAAILKYKDALTISRGIDDHSSRLAIVLRKLGLVHLKASNNEDAVEYLSEALDILEEGDDQASNMSLIPSTIAGLARSFSNVGSYDSAIAFFQRHVDLLRSDPSSSDVVSDSFFAMGTIYGRLNNLDDAISHFRECLLVRKSNYGGTDERVARVLINMGVVFEKQEDLVSAKDCFTEAVRIYKINGNERDASTGLQDLGRTLVKQGALDSAIECYCEAIQISKKVVGSNDPQVASLHYICGIALYDKGDFDKALASFRQSVRIRTKLSSASKENAESLCMVGQTLVKQGEFEEAIDALNEALGSLLLIKGPDSLDVGNCHHALGLAFSAKGDHKDAVAHYLNAIPPRQRYFGVDSLEVAATHFELGEEYSRIGEWDSAAEYAVSALRIRKATMEAETLEYAESVSQLGGIQLALLKYSDALNCFVEALKIFSVLEGRGHVTVAHCLEKIGSIYVEQNQHSEAVESLKRAMKIYTETLGGLSSPVASVLLALGKVEVKKRSPDNAVAYFKQSLQISKELNEDAHVATALFEIGAVLESKGRGAEALECFKETLRLAVNPESATTRAKTFNKIGGILADQENFEGAMKACEKALVLFNEGKGTPVVEIGEVYQIMAGVHEANGEYDAALGFFQKAHTIFVDRLGQTDLSVARVLNNLSINYARRGDFPKAFELCCEALEIRREKLGSADLDTCDTLYNVANILDEWGKIDDAMKYYTEALESYRCTLGPEDIEVANCFQYIGSLHVKKEEDEQAMRAFAESLRIYQLLGEESTGMATILFNLGVLYNRRYDHEKALEVLGHCLRLQKTTNSDTNELASTCDQIGVAYAGKKFRSESKIFFQKSLAMLMDAGKQDTIETANVLVHFAAALSDEDEFDVALKRFHEALQIFNRDIGENSEEAAATLMQIGIIHNKRVDYEEALRLLTAALKIRSALYGRDDMKVAETLFEIGKVMEEWGDSDEVSFSRVWVRHFEKESLHLQIGARHIQ
jgi:tetratricopeptide (TPR) repeat protein